MHFSDSTTVRVFRKIFDSFPLSAAFHGKYAEVKSLCMRVLRRLPLLVLTTESSPSRVVGIRKCLYHTLFLLGRGC